MRDLVILPIAWTGKDDAHASFLRIPVTETAKRRRLLPQLHSGERLAPASQDRRQQTRARRFERRALVVSPLGVGTGSQVPVRWSTCLRDDEVLPVEGSVRDVAEWDAQEV